MMTTRIESVRKSVRIMRKGQHDCADSLRFRASEEALMRPVSMGVVQELQMRILVGTFEATGGVVGGVVERWFLRNFRIFV